MRALVIARSGAFCEGCSWGVFGGCEGGRDVIERIILFIGETCTYTIMVSRKRKIMTSVVMY